MDERVAKIYLDGNAADCIKDFPFDTADTQEAQKELGGRVWARLEQSQSPHELWSMLEAATALDIDFEKALNGSIPIHGAYGGMPLANKNVVLVVKYCILHNILYMRSLELLVSLRRAEHGVYE